MNINMGKLKQLLGFIFAIGCFVSFMGGFMYMAYLDSSLDREVKNIIDKCELEVPRNKKCKLVAVIDDKA